MPNEGTHARTQNDTGNPLAPYFPRLTIDWLASTPEARHREMEGTVAFVDISGFTKLSEGLARHGKVGAEELTATIGSCFVSLLHLAYARGGRLLKFGGDALLLHFSGESHEARACLAAIDMRRELRVVGRLTVLGQRVLLRMSVGVHSGRFHFFLVGDSHRELIVTGPAASTTVSMEAAAEAGEIVVSEATAAALGPRLVGAPKGPGRLLLRSPAGPEPDFMLPAPVEAGVELLRGVPVGLREALTSAHQQPEHRRVTLAFIHFDGTDRLIEEAGPAETARQLDRLVSDVQRAVDRQQVTFLATDIDRDGGKIILTSGAPSTFGDDEHRMLLALREVMDAGGPLSIRIGVNRGSVFVGEVGPPYRRTFTVMGDAVNLAARLMAKAEPGQVLTTPEVLSRSRTGFAAVELEPFFVKGKAKPVRAFSLGARTGALDEGPVDHPLFAGRDEELRTLEQLVEAAKKGEGRLVEIVGEPGMGKSRLVAQLRQLAAGMVQLSAVCERYDSSTPYHAVRGLLRNLLKLPADRNDEAAAAQFLDEVASRAPGVLPWAPLIAGVLDLSVPETRETRELEEEFRRTRLAEAVIELLGHLLPHSGLLTVEEAHFMDQASAELFGRLAGAVGATSWLICVTRRDVESGFVAPSEDTTRIKLRPLDEKAATALAEVVTKDAPLSPRELGALVERSGGNPLFLRELIAASRSGETLEALPDSIEEVIAARIDRLSNDDRYLLRQLAVLGQSFSTDLLPHVVDELPGEEDATWKRLEEFVARDGRGNMSFRNVLLHDSAYDGLSYRLRRELHARAGDTIRLSRGEEQPELLSFHYLHAQRYPEAFSYSIAAAERAKSVYANVEAAEFYERALLAGRRLDQLTRAELAEVHEALGDARNRAGAYVEAAAAYRSARRLAEDDALAEARLALKLARVQAWLDRYASVLRWITKGLNILKGNPSAEAARQRAELLAWYGRCCQDEGRHQRALKWSTLAVAEAEAVGHKEALADALRFIDYAKMELGQLEEPVNWVRALALFEELENLPGQSGVLNMLGMFAYFRGEWDKALELYKRAQVTVHRTGNAVMDAIYVLNIGEIFLDQGRLDEAEQRFDYSSRVFRAARYRTGMAYLNINIARLAARQGRYEDALGIFEESLAESRKVGAHEKLLEATARKAECLLLSGEVAAALAVADEGLVQARSLGGVPAQIPLLQRVRGVALARTDRNDSAREALEESLSAARGRGAEYEVALSSLVMAELGIDADAVDRQELRRRAEATLSKLGVVSPPDLLGARDSVSPSSNIGEEQANSERDLVTTLSS
jgi:class 3 adenylate cyclase/tetratricopeptide (TPR) repeat protein